MSNEKIYNPQSDVADFMRACGQEVPAVVTMADRKTLLLRAKLLYEEVKEFIVASGCQLYNDHVYIDANVEPDMVEMYDAIVDINYVSYGAACALGLAVQPGHNEVHKSNLTKVMPDGKVLKNEAGKIQKPEGYVKPDLKRVLKELGYE